MVEHNADSDAGAETVGYCKACRVVVSRYHADNPSEFHTQSALDACCSQCGRPFRDHARHVDPTERAGIRVSMTCPTTPDAWDEAADALLIEKAREATRVTTPASPKGASDG